LKTRSLSQKKIEATANTEPVGENVCDAEKTVTELKCVLIRNTMPKSMNLMTQKSTNFNVGTPETSGEFRMSILIWEKGLIRCFMFLM
jgi:hypothetical protein